MACAFRMSAGRTLAIHQGGDDVHDVRRVDRLAQEYVVPGGAGLAHPEALREERHGDRGNVVAWRPRAHPADEFEPVLAGQSQIAHDDVDLRGAQELARFRSGAGGEHEGAERLEGGDQQLDRIVVVVDDQRANSRQNRSLHGAHEIDSPRVLSAGSRHR